MTEDDAKTKWCPMVRQSFDGVAINVTDSEFPPCIGSACMMWREKSVWVEDHLGNFGEQSGGYCGLAGSPAR